MYLNPVQYGGDMKNHEKLHMFARDIIRVRNPLSSDFTFMYDSVPYTVAAKQAKDFERYLADKYVWDITQAIIGEMQQQKGKEALAEYVKNNPNLLLDKYIENRQIWDKIPRMDDPELQRTVVRNVVVGLVSKFGEGIERVKPKAKLDTHEPMYRELLSEFTKVPLDRMSPEEQKQVGYIPSGTPGDAAQTVSDRSLEADATVA